MMVEGVEAVDNGIPALAAAAKVPGYQVGGKTGTAEVAAGRPTHAWFIGVAPADDPELVIAVIKEGGGGGGQVATPIAQRVLAQGLQNLASRR
jgi:cell division protein FtsI/penicillin-binding protein 2